MRSRPSSFGADFEEAAAGRRKADRQDRQRRNHGARLLQRFATQGDARRRQDRWLERRRHHQRADGGHADLRLARGELGASKQAFEKPHQALVYDLGGGTFDVTVVRYTPTHFQVLATDGDVQLGGVDWNDRILDHVAKEFQARHNLDIRSRRPRCRCCVTIATRPRSRFPKTIRRRSSAGTAARACRSRSRASNSRI